MVGKGEVSPLLPQKRPRRCRKFFVLFYSVGLLITSLGNSIYFKKMTDAMPNYPYFLAQVTNVVYMPIFFLLVEWQKRYTSTITDSMQRFPKYRFAIMGAFDALAGLLMLFGGVHTAGSMQALLGNAVIPVTLIISYFLLRAKFFISQLLGAVIILVGVGVELSPSLFGSGHEDETNNRLLFNLIFVSCALPQALSAVYKESVFACIDMDVNYLQYWVAWYQLWIGICLIPVNTLPFLGPNYVPWSQLFNSIWDGSKCLMGINSVTTGCYSILVPTTSQTYSFHAIEFETKLNSTSLLSSIPPCDACPGAWLPVFLYLFFNISCAVFTVLVIKYGNAAFMYLVNALRLPLVQVAFCLRIFNDPPDQFQLPCILGLVLTLLGLVFYQWHDFFLLSQVDVTDPSALGSRATSYMSLSPLVEKELDHMVVVYDQSTAKTIENEERSVRLIGGGGGSGSGQIDVTALPPSPSPFRRKRRSRNPIKKEAERLLGFKPIETS